MSNLIPFVLGFLMFLFFVLIGVAGVLDGIPTVAVTGFVCALPLGLLLYDEVVRR